jgi:hypothetical protein
VTDRPEDQQQRDQRRERLLERMDPGPVTLDREPVGGPIPQLTDEELRDLGLMP